MDTSKAIAVLSGLRRRIGGLGIGLGVWLLVTGIPSDSLARQAETRTPANPTQGTYRSDRLGIEYRLEPYQGHYGARLTRPPSPGSPLANIRLATGFVSYLEPGDMIVALDRMVIDGPDDIENHILLTTIRFVNIRTGQPELATAMFPNDLGGGGAGPAGESRMVQAVVVIDTQSELAGLDQDRNRILEILHVLEAEGRCQTTLLEGPQATANALLNTLRQLGTAAGNTVFVYYSGHGATDPTRGHALTFTAGPPLLRSTLRAELQRLNPRLTLLVSDCCSNVVELPPEIGAPLVDPRPNIRSLFLRTQGVVDINSSTYDPSRNLEESAWGLTDGGLFTKALFQTIYFSEFQTLDSNGDGLLTWTECLPPIAQDTAQSYGMLRRQVLSDPERADERTVDQLRRQSSQTPQAFALDSGLIETGGTRRQALGINYSTVNLFDPALGNVAGARIDALRPGMPAARAGLEVGDIITAINGQGLRTSNDLPAILSRSGQTARVRLRNVRDGQFLEVPVVLEGP